MKRDLNKKGVSFVLVTMILLVVVFFVLLVLGRQIITLVNSGTDDFMCTWSAIMNSNLKLFDTEFFRLRCKINVIHLKYEPKTNDLIIRKNGQLHPIYIPGDLTPAINKWNKNYDKSFDITKPQYRVKYTFNTLLAREMVKCKSKLGNGKLNLFSSWFNPLKSGVNKFVCVVCDRIVIDDATYNDLSKVLDVKTLDDDLQTYTLPGKFLMSNPVSFYGSKSSVSFWEALKFSPEQSDFFSDYNFKFGRNILIVYVVQKKILKDVPVIGSVIHFGDKEGDSSYQGLMIITPDQLSKYCEVIVN